MTARTREVQLRTVSVETKEIFLRTTRGMAWERAKAELGAMLLTFYTGDAARPSQFDELSSCVRDFIEEVESGGLHE